MGVEELEKISRRYGQDSAWVLAGGGNTSFKNEETLWVKASGYALATLTRDGLVALDRKKLAEVWNADYPEEPEKREERALADLMDARLPEDNRKRPSVETLMHDLLPYDYVVHTHPALINGVTCGQNGEAETRRLFGESVLWVPLVDPGFILARTIRELLHDYRERHNGAPKLLFLQNHGLVIASDDLDEIETLHEQVAEKIREALRREPDLNEPVETVKQAGLIENAVTEALRELSAESSIPEEHRTQLKSVRHVRFSVNREIEQRVADRDSFAPLAAPFTPDHIVYAGHNPPFIEGPPAIQGLAERVKRSLGSYLEDAPLVPKTIALQGLGIVAMTPNASAAEKALALFTDAAQIAACAESFGGPRPMDEERIQFILSWEVESYRAQISTGG